MRAVLLDLDDTLLDYTGDVDTSWAEACATGLAAAGLEAPGLVAAVASSRQWFWSDPGRHRRERVDMLRAWTLIVEHAATTVGLAADGLPARIAAEYRARRQARMRLFADSVTTLAALRARGLALGLVTNGDAREQRDKIERHGLRDYFDAILIEGEFGAGKPDAAVYEHVLGKLGVSPRAAAMVGDRLDFDVAGSQAVGCLGIWIDRAGTGLPGDSPVTPDRIIRSLTELLD